MSNVTKLETKPDAEAAMSGVNAEIVRVATHLDNLAALLYEVQDGGADHTQCSIVMSAVSTLIGVLAGDLMRLGGVAKQITHEE